MKSLPSDIPLPQPDVTLLSAKEDTKTYACQVLTPMYGGGVKAGVVDQSMPIRTTAIRGQLRFWWRIAHSRSEAYKTDGKIDWGKVFVAERAIFGGLGDTQSLTRSQVSLSVKQPNKRPQLAPAFEYKRGDGGRYKTSPEIKNWASRADYALFPARGQLAPGGQTIAEHPGKFVNTIEGSRLEFSITLRFDPCLPEAQRQEVFTALRWWATFGNVGARGRRGLGAVHIPELSPISAAQAKDAGCVLVLQNEASHSPVEAWKIAISALRAFRQGEKVGRNPGKEGNRPGRSRWPEPDAIRRLSKTNSAQHQPEHPAGDLFPRAYFGMPIIFHFKDKGDPQDFTLQPVGHDRLASPVLLRPYPEAGGWKAAALILPVSMPKTELQAGRQSFTVTLWPGDDAQRSAAVQATQPMKDALEGRSSNPLTAFVQFFKKYPSNQGSRA